MGIVTLLSDLGYNDAGAAKAKGILMQQLPGIQVIDITHNIQPYYLQQAAYLLASSARDFPAGTFQVVLFDLYYNARPQLILTEVSGQYILAPDNGVLPLAFHERMGDTWLCYEMDETGNLSSWVAAAANTIQMLQQSSATDAGLSRHILQNAPLHSKPGIYGNYIECHVIHIDRFENVILNITKPEFEAAAKGRAFSINLLRDDTISILSNHYNAVNPGDKLCRFNSAGYLEIAINKGKAASLFGLRLMQEQQLMYNTIKINFE